MENRTTEFNTTHGNISESVTLIPVDNFDAMFAESQRHHLAQAGLKFNEIYPPIMFTLGITGNALSLGVMVMVSRLYTIIHCA